MEVLAHRSWPELVMHVLAHVPGSAPASLYDPIYIAFAEQHLGCASERALAEDVAVLWRALPDHDTLARVQLLAWLFDDAAAAAAVATTDLADLSRDAVARPELLPALRACGPIVEVLRCAAELEREAYLTLPPVAYDADALRGALTAVAPAAPLLADCTILPLRALRVRGRVMVHEIWIGAPSPALSLTAEHAAWQAAHEATVSEIAALGEASERGVERVALCVLAERARRTALQPQHAGWLGHLADASCDRDALSPPERQLCDQALERSGT